MDRRVFLKLPAALTAAVAFPQLSQAQSAPAVLGESTEPVYNRDGIILRTPSPDVWVEQGKLRIFHRRIVSYPDVVMPISGPLLGRRLTLEAPSIGTHYLGSRFDKVERHESHDPDESHWIWEGDANFLAPYEEYRGEDLGPSKSEWQGDDYFQTMYWGSGPKWNMRRVFRDVRVKIYRKKIVVEPLPGGFESRFIKGELYNLEHLNDPAFRLIDISWIPADQVVHPSYVCKVVR